MDVSPPPPLFGDVFLASFLCLGSWIRLTGVFFRRKMYFYVFFALWDDYVGFGSFFLWQPLAFDPSLTSSPAVMRHAMHYFHYMVSVKR